MKLKEIEREYVNNTDIALNKHSYRIYKDEKGQRYLLDRNQDMLPKTFELSGPFDRDFKGILPLVKVDGERFFCEGESWNKAIKKMCEVLNAELVK